MSTLSVSICQPWPLRRRRAAPNSESAVRAHGHPRGALRRVRPMPPVRGLATPSNPTRFEGCHASGRPHWALLPATLTAPLFVAPLDSSPPPHSALTPASAPRPRALGVPPFSQVGRERWRDASGRGSARGEYCRCLRRRRGAWCWHREGARARPTSFPFPLILSPPPPRSHSPPPSPS